MKIKITDLKVRYSKRAVAMLKPMITDFKTVNMESSKKPSKGKRRDWKHHSVAEHLLEALSSIPQYQQRRVKKGMNIKRDL